ncbi:phage portal protein [Azospirillum griseum]|uniref:Phage portal protein n=1 Tax=Azospirillum griseum TaxID=2496639 RepID=A0A3S0HXJ2_9PROT|nr:phage portal protein [Azospirillum griseum]
MRNASVRIRIKGTGVYVEPFRAQAQPAFASTGQGKRTASMRRVSGAGPNSLVGSNVALLRQQSRQSTRTQWASGRAVDLAVTHTIGTGIKPQSLCPDPAFREAVQQLWYDWTEFADADGVLDFYGLQALAVQEWVEGGECFARLRPRRPSDGLPVPLQVQLIEPEQVPLDHTTIVTGGNSVVQGIERDSVGRRAAYWMHRQHPGEWVLGNGDSSLVRVLASEVLHLYHPTRAGQLRGIPQLSRMLVRLNDAGQYEDAEIVRKKVAAMKMGAITRKPGSNEGDPLVGEGEADATGVADVGMEPGTMLVLEDGEDVKWFDPVDVGGNFETFMRWNYRGVAASVNQLYEEVTGDYSTLNDRTFRAAFNTFKRRYAFYQHNIVAHQFCSPVWRRFIDLALIAGTLQRPPGMTDRDLYRVAWTPDRWAYIHPLQDVQAVLKEIEGGLSSRAKAVSERGDDIEDIDRQRSDDARREQTLGLAPVAPSDGGDRYRVTPSAPAPEPGASKP